MSSDSAIKPDPTAIGEVSAPPFARVPDPGTMFAVRAARLRHLAVQSEIGPYLLFLAALAQAQHKIQEGLAPPQAPAADALRRAATFGMPPLDRGGFIPDVIFAQTLDRLLAAAATIAQPPAAAAARDRVAQATAEGRQAMIANVLADAIPVEALAEHVLVAAALQVHFARQAAMLEARGLVPVGDGVCPACGGPPVASLVVGWPGAHGARFCACSLCGTLWNYVRVKCVLCGSTKGIGYQEIEGGAGTIKAETCDACHGYVKILHQHKDPGCEPVADDVASLGLDLLMGKGDYRRGSVNPFLLGY